MTETAAKPKSAGKFVSLVDALGYTDELGDGTVKYAGRGDEVELSEAEHKRLMDSADYVDNFPPIAKPGSKAAVVLGKSGEQRFDPISLVPMSPGQSVSMDTVNSLGRQHLQELFGADEGPGVDPAGDPADEVKEGSEIPAEKAAKDYSGLNKKQLSAEASSRGIEVPQKTKNAEIVALLQADDAGADEGVTPRVGAERSSTYA